MKTGRGPALTCGQLFSCFRDEALTPLDGRPVPDYSKKATFDCLPVVSLALNVGSSSGRSPDVFLTLHKVSFPLLKWSWMQWTPNGLPNGKVEPSSIRWSLSANSTCMPKRQQICTDGREGGEGTSPLWESVCLS